MHVIGGVLENENAKIQCVDPELSPGNLPIKKNETRIIGFLSLFLSVQIDFPCVVRKSDKNIIFTFPTTFFFLQM